VVAQPPLIALDDPPQATDSRTGSSSNGAPARSTRLWPCVAQNPSPIAEAHRRAKEAAVANPPVGGAEPVSIGEHSANAIV
jgi:hypothetical protein